MSQDCVSLLGAVRAWDPLRAWICLVVAVCGGEDFQGLGWGGDTRCLEEEKGFMISLAKWEDFKL